LDIEETVHPKANDSDLRQARRWRSVVASGLIRWCVHCLISMAGGMALWVLLSGSNDFVWFNPRLWVPSLLLGLAVNLAMNNWSACWTWLAGLLFFACETQLFSIPFTKWHAWISHSQRMLFPLGAQDCRGSGCLGFFIFTAPAFCAISYSVGAAVAKLIWAIVGHFVDQTS
jgi:hypothetical protein